MSAPDPHRPLLGPTAELVLMRCVWWSSTAHAERRAAQARPALGPSPGAAGSACAILRCMEIIEAEFENGVLRPMRRLALRPGERVGIVVVRRPDPTRWNLARLSKVAAPDEEKLAEEGLADWADALDCEDRR